VKNEDLDNKFMQEFWTDNDSKFIIFKNFTERNEFIEFLHEHNIPMNDFAYNHRKDKARVSFTHKELKYKWNMLYISRKDRWLGCKHAPYIERNLKHKKISKGDFLRLFKLTYFDIYGNYSPVPINIKGE